MGNLKLKQEQSRTDISLALRRRLDRKLEEAGIAFDKTYTDEWADQLRIQKLRNRARNLAQQVIVRQPDNLDALNLLGRIALDEGNLAQANEYIDRGLEFDLNSPDLNYSRGHICLIAQQYAEAESYFARAERLAPGLTRARVSLAYTHLKQGNFVEAFAEYRELIKRDPTDPHVRDKLFESIRYIQADYYAKDLEQELIGYLDFTQVDPNDLSKLISSLLIHKYDLISGQSPLDPEQLSKDELLNKALRRCQFKDPVMEEFLTACRQCILQESIERQQINAGFMEFLVSISLQCINNEFVYSVSLTEEKVLSELVSMVTNTVVARDWQTHDVEYPLLLLSMYSLLHHYGFRSHLLRKPLTAWSPQVQVVLDPHLYEPQREFEIQRSVVAITPITNHVSQSVNEQYEESPYPRWQLLSHAVKTDYGQALAAELKGFKAPGYFNSQTLRVLVAGCGTGKHAIQVAKYFRNVEVTAIDLSKASLAYATKMSRKLNVNNIEFYQADILELNENPQFHIIECSGVLHHMADPTAGLLKLKNMLVPGGLLKLGLYSQRARRIVTEARQIIDENQLTPCPEHMRIFRQAILDDQIDGDLQPIKQSPDFYNLSGCRDLLFNVQEHQYTPLGLAKLLDELDLEFLGFVNLPYKVKCLYDRKFPADGSRTSLTHWDELEEANPAIFAGMYQFYCRQKAGQLASFPD